MRCVLVGNYGVANLGDEALRDYFLHTFTTIEWVVVSAHPYNPNEVPRLPGGLRSLFTTNWWKTVKVIRSSDALVFGGGSLFTDVESVYACFLWSVHAWTAIFLGKPVHLAFQGMGPYKTRVGEWLARSVARKAASISVRDEASVHRLEAWGLSTKVVQTFDPVFSFMVSQKKDHITKNVFIVIPRHNSGELLKKQMLQMLAETSNIEDVHIVLMQPDDAAEQATADALHSALPVPATIVPVRTMEELMEEVSGVTCVLTQRFHGALAALAAGSTVSIVTQGEGDKLSQLLPFARGEQSVGGLIERVNKGEECLAQALHIW